jgi:hypothetical protein
MGAIPKVSKVNRILLPLSDHFVLYSNWYTLRPVFKRMNSPFDTSVEASVEKIFNQGFEPLTMVRVEVERHMGWSPKPL